MDYGIPDQQSPEWISYKLAALKRTARYLAIMKAGGFEANVWDSIDLIEWLQHDKHELGREVEYLRGELANVQRDRMAQAEVERLRQDVQFWTDETRKFKESSRHNYAECARLRALITEWVEADRGEAEGSYDRFREAVRALRREANR